MCFHMILWYKKLQHVFLEEYNNGNLLKTLISAGTAMHLRDAPKELVTRNLLLKRVIHNNIDFHYAPDWEFT